VLALPVKGGRERGRKRRKEEVSERDCEKNGNYRETVDIIGLMAIYYLFG
jgi:hypothetical protein